MCKTSYFAPADVASARDAHRHEAVDDGTCTGHLRGVPVLFRVLHVLPTVSTAPLPWTQGLPRWNLHWAYPRRPGVVSCTTRTTYCKYCTIAIDTGPSPMEVALGISAASRCCFVYYTYYLLYFMEKKTMTKNWRKPAQGGARRADWRKARKTKPGARKTRKILHTWDASGARWRKVEHSARKVKP